MTKNDVIYRLKNGAEGYYKLSDDIWELAEERFQEKHSSKLLINRLKEEGFRIEEIPGLPTAFRAEWGHGKPCIGFIGEYDALVGMSQVAGVTKQIVDPARDNGHGCGHHLLGVGSLIGAIGLKDYLKENNISGTVVYYGCPAEEGGSGKAFMSREGYFQELDCGLCWHPADVTMMAPGTFLSNCTVKYSFTGKASHAAASPEMGRSALDALELTNIGIQFLREHIPTTDRIHYAITDAGGISPNIVQPTASGLYQLRAKNNKDLEDLYGRVNNIVYGAALMTGTNYTVEYLKGSSNTLLNRTLDEIVNTYLLCTPNTAKYTSEYNYYKDIIRTFNPEFKEEDVVIDTEVKPYNPNFTTVLPGSSDTGDVSWNCPLAQFGATVFPKGVTLHSWQAVACGKTELAHKGMLFAGTVMAQAAIELVSDPMLLSKVKKEFYMGTKDNPYKCPIPDCISPQYVERMLK